MDETALGEWVCERCGEVYDTPETALDCGWWDWIYDIGPGTCGDDASQAA
jgi:hypothetical protein